VIFPEDKEEKQKEFILPTYWQIERTKDTGDVINEWMNNHHNTWDKYTEYEDLYGYTNNKNKQKVKQPDLPTITFEQFEKYVLNKKAETMKQKIDYYEVIKKVPFKYKIGDKLQKATNVKEFDEAANYPEFFKPVYIEELKAGDYIVFTQPFDGTNKGYITCINKITDEDVHMGAHGWIYYTREDGSVGGFRWGKEGYKLNKAFRKATKEEAIKASIVQIGGYKAEVKGNKVAFGCQEFTKADLGVVLRLLKSPINGKLTVGETTVKVEHIVKALKLL